MHTIATKDVGLSKRRFSPTLQTKPFQKTKFLALRIHYTQGLYLKVLLWSLAYSLIWRWNWFFWKSLVDALIQKYVTMPQLGYLFIRLPPSNLRVVTWGRAKASLYCNNDVIILTLGRVGQNLQFLSVFTILLFI